MVTYMVVWTHNRQRFFVDIDDEQRALSLAVALAELGRSDVAVERAEFEIDPATSARIRERIMERIRNAGVCEVAEELWK